MPTKKTETAKELAKLKAENERLVAQNAELIRQQQPAKPIPQEKSHGGLEQQTWDILKHFFDHPHPMSVRMFAGQFSLEHSVAHHHVDILLALHFIHIQGRDYTMLRMSGAVDPMFVIGPLGRDFYMAHRDAT